MSFTFERTKADAPNLHIATHISDLATASARWTAGMANHTRAILCAANHVPELGCGLFLQHLVLLQFKKVAQRVSNGLCEVRSR
jgi:hypothetical protein